MITQTLIAEYFEYKDGDLYWIKAPYRNKENQIGQIAGSIHKTGYRHITWMNKIHKAHRLIFLLQNGYLPKEIDHINGDRADNRIENLREATRSQNQFNKSMQRNMSGHRGVTWHKKTQKWAVRVMMNNVSRSFGYYDDLEFAALVAEEARIKLFGGYAYDSRAA